MIAFLVTMVSPAAAEPGAEDVYRALGVFDAPTDYVVLVDTSGSMAEHQRYDNVRTNLRTFFGKLGDRDLVTLVTFDVVPSMVHSGSPKSAVAAVDAMPVVPRGAATDIGAALELAVSLLEGGKPGLSGAIVLITDGIARPPAASRYHEQGGPAWSELAARGRGLASRTGGYVVPVASGESGTDQMRSVVPGTVLLPYAEGVGDFLSRLQEQVKRGNARRALGDDLTSGVEVSWSVPDGADLADPVAAKLVLRSTARAMPLELRNLRVETQGLPGEVRGLPDRVELAAGERRELELTMSSTEPAWKGIGRVAHPVRADLRFAADVGTSWRPVLERDLGVRLENPAASAGGTWNGVLTKGVRWLYLLFAFVALITLPLTGFLLWARRNPVMRGVLVAIGGDDTTHRIPLHGSRRVTFPRPEAGGLGGRFRVRGATAPRGTPVLTYLKPDGTAGQSRMCPPDAGDLDLYGVVFRYHRNATH
ncbi:von Willebrand factor type A domain-containing protein [Lentzea albidocapillata subsp. violacea]|uniref:von Willebrand factor type A domain-containing protein n=1 Tax=Lentzea albidocapillata subsp. violacea TaxID=128104 RepID=A0A1G9QY20_9PSEU|nr:von Willebrand factor type A domain-containing protein [Lentzea albidocapillata subsp. violacea]